MKKVHTKRVLATFILFFHITLGLSQKTYSQEVLTWEDCVREVSRNPDLNAALAKVRAAQFQKKGAYSGLLPQLSGSLGYTYGNSTSSAIVPGTSGTTPIITDDNNRTSTYTASLTASQNLFSGLQDAANIKAGQANIESAKANLKSVKAQVSFNLKSAFANLLYAQESLRLTRDIIKRREDNLNLIELRYESGRENKGSFLLSKAYLQQARYETLQAQNSLKIAQQQLAEVLGRDDNALTVRGNVPIHLPPDGVSPAQVLDTPDYQQVIAQKKSAQASLTGSRSGFFPSLNVTATTSRRDDEWFPQNNRWAIGGSLSWPFFNGGKDYFATRAASANLQSAILQEASVKRQTLTKLDTSFADFMEMVEKLKTDQSFLEAAQAREEIARHRYENGLLTFEDWDIIENDFISRQKQVLLSQRDRIVREATWEQTQGKGVVP